MRNKIKVVIFDMDGLIVDNEGLHSLAHEIVIKEYNKTPTFTELGTVHTVGIAGRDMWPILKVKYDINEKPETLRNKKEHTYFNIIKKSKIKPNKGLYKLIKIFNNKGFKKAVASGSQRKQILLILDRLKITNKFNVIVSGDDIIKGKPNPEIYLKAASKLNINPKFCLALEDSESGVTAAKRAGMKVIAVPNKYSKKQNFSKADKIVNSLSEITISMLNKL